MIPEENKEGVRQILLAIEGGFSTKYSVFICLNKVRTKETEAKFNFDFNLAKSFDLIGSVRENVNGVRMSFLTLTKYGVDFLNDKKDEVTDELGRIKLFLNSVKEKKYSIHLFVSRAFELGLVVAKDNCWRLTEFGEEFLVEANNESSN